MTVNLWSLACSGLVAIGLAGATAAPSAAAPLAPINLPMKADASQSVVPVSHRCRNGRCFNRRGDFRFSRHRFDDDRFVRRHHRRHHRRHFRHGPNIVFGLGLGFPAYHYYAQPRPVYRYRSGSSAHVQWCYDRYRSYRAYDNTFQPYNGPRQLCWSPYS